MPGHYELQEPNDPERGAVSSGLGDPKWYYRLESRWRPIKRRRQFQIIKKVREMGVKCVEVR